MASNPILRDANAIRQAYTASPSPSSPLLSSARRPSFNPPPADQPPSFSFYHPPSAPFLEEQDVPLNSSYTRSLTPSSSSASPSLLHSQRPASSIPLSQSQLNTTQDYSSLRRPSHTPLSTSQPLAHTQPSHTSPNPNQTPPSRTPPYPSSSHLPPSHSSPHPTFSASVKNAKDNKAPPTSFSSSILASRYASLRPPSSVS